MNAIVPIPEPKKAQEERNIKIEHREGKGLDFAYDLSSKYYFETIDRRKSVESKATILIASTGFIVTVSLTFSLDFFTVYFSALSVIPRTAFLVLLVFSILNFFVSIIYVMRVLKSEVYYIIGDRNIATNDKNYKMKIVETLIEYGNKNNYVIDRKYVFLTLAQKCFMRALIFLFILIVLMIIFHLSVSNPNDFNIRLI